MAFTFLLKRSATAAHAPLVSDLSVGELALNTNDGIVYFRKGANTIVALGPTPATANALTTARNIALSGDASGTASFDGSANATIATTLATVNSNVGTFNTVVVNAKGLVTAASVATYLTNVVATGDATGTSVANALTLTLANVNTNVGAFGTATVVPTITTNAKGLITAVSNTAITFPVTTVFGRTGTVTLLGSDVTTALGYTPVNNAVLGVANGVATLDSSGKLTSAQIPASVTGGMVYTGTWNASTNTPTLTSGTGTKGTFYKVATAGTTTVDGISSWNLGDSIVFDGTTWDKLDGIANEVISVAGRTGTVTLAVADVTGAAPLAAPSFTGNATSTTPASSDSSTSIATTAFVKSLNYTVGPITASGDATGTAVGNAIALTLATVNSNVGTFAGIAVNAKGQVTGATALTTLAGYGITTDTIDGGSF